MCGVGIEIALSSRDKRREIQEEAKPMTQAEQALVDIKSYLGKITAEDAYANRIRVWQEVIQFAKGYDEEATAEADPSHTNQVAAFTDSSRLWWNHSLSQWEAE
jgi:hypothetical protein